MLAAPVTLLVGYLVGAVPFGFLAGKIKGIDVRTQGSGNIGATNVGRLLGSRWGIGVFLLDLAKGLFGVLLGGILSAQWPEGMQSVAPLAGGIAAFLGHLFPVYLGFKGGKGVATGAGVALGLLPGWCVEALGIWLIVTLTTRMVSAGSLVAASWLTVRSLLALGQNPAQPAAWFGVLGGAFVLFKHRSNWTRIRAGTENRFKEGPLFRWTPPTLHLLTLGAWLSLGLFVTFVAGLGLFDRFNRIAAEPEENRPYWLQVAPSMERESPGKEAGLPTPLRLEQGGILAGNAVGVLFGPYFKIQVALGIVVLATAVWFPRSTRYWRLRTTLATLALVGAFTGAWVEKKVEILRLKRNQATEKYLVNTLKNPEQDTPATRKSLQEIRGLFGAWHGVSVSVNLGTIALVAGISLLSFPALGGLLVSQSGSQVRRKDDEETEIVLPALPDQSTP